MDVYRDGDGETVIPRDLSDAEMLVRVENASGGFTEFTGSGAADGTFRVPDVPEEWFYLRIPTSYDEYRWLHTSERDLELVGESAYVRGEGAAPTEETTLSFDIEGLAPWEEGQDLWIVAPLHGWRVHHLLRPFEVEPGDTSLLEELDYRDVEGYAIVAEPRLLAGDAVIVAQHTKRESGGVDYVALDRFVQFEEVTVADGETVELAGELAAAPLSSLEIDYRGAAFGDLAESMCGESPAVSFASLTALAVPGGLDHGRRSPPIQLFSAEPPYADESITFEYGDPFPAAWGTTVRALLVCREDREGAASKVSSRVVDVEALADGALLAPGMGPVVDIEVDGQTGATDPVVAESATPLVTWSAPSLGEPVEYAVRVSNERISTKITTTETEVRIPPGVLDSELHSTIEITARGHDTTGGRVPLPRSLAEAHFPAAVTLEL